MFIYGAWVFMMLFCSAPVFPLCRHGPESPGNVTGVTWAAQTCVAVRPLHASDELQALSNDDLYH